MADENTIIEGTVKFRDGKKWKSRWCVMRKLSPVADCVQLQLYRNARGTSGAGWRGACCAALSLAEFVGAESGFTLDKHSNTLALVCRDLVAVLAFDTRERLIQWQVKVNGALGGGRSHMVVVRGSGGASAGAAVAGPARLHVRSGAAALTTGVPPRLLRYWPLRHLRRYGLVDGRFCLEGGSLCGAGEGLHVLVADRSDDIAADFERANADGHSPPRRPRTLLRYDGTASEAGDGGVWGAPRPEAGVDDTVSLRGDGADSEQGRSGLERCMSCMSKLGAAMSRSSTAALTPAAAAPFNPAWTMDAPSDPQSGVPPHRASLQRACSCGGLADGSDPPLHYSYDDYDVPRVPSAEVEGEYYDTPKRLRDRLDSDVYRISRSATADALILKKPCGCLLRLARRRRMPRVLDAAEDAPASCPCRRVADWAHSWVGPAAAAVSCRRSATAGDLTTSIADKENATPGANAVALYATVDLARKTRRRPADLRPLAHYENLDFARSLELYENALSVTRRAAVTCGRCGSTRLPHDHYLTMRPAAGRAATTAGYAPMSPLCGAPPCRTADHEKSASNPSLCAIAAGDARRRQRPRSSSADSSRFLDDVEEFDGGGSASSLETLRGATRGTAGNEDADGDDAVVGADAVGAAAGCGGSGGGGDSGGGGGARDSSSSADSGVSVRARPPRARRPRPHSCESRGAPPPAAAAAPSGDIELPLLAIHSLRGADSRSTSSGTSDMSDYVETLSLCSSHSSSDTPVTMRAGASSSLRPRSGKEYARAAAAAAALRADHDAR